MGYLMIGILGVLGLIGLGMIVALLSSALSSTAK